MVIVGLFAAAMQQGHFKVCLKFEVQTIASLVVMA